MCFKNGELWLENDEIPHFLRQFPDLRKYRLSWPQLTAPLQAVSVVIVGSGASYLSKVNAAITDSAHVPQSSVVFLVVVGAGVMIISFMGCCGAMRESPCLLRSFAGVVLVLLLAELVVGALVIKYRGEFEQVASEGLLEALHNRNDTGYNAIDDIQTQLHCCGVRSVKDYNDTEHLPHSCCPLAVSDAECKKEQAYAEDCLSALKNELSPVWRTVAIACILVAVIQAAAVIGSCLLARAFRREYDVV